MKHLVNLINFILLFIPSVIVQVAGLLAVPIGLLLPKVKFQPRRRMGQDYRMLKIFWLWDNYDTGLSGDYGWQHKGFNVNSYWARLRWLFRNRASNFQNWIGVHTTITRIEGHGARWKQIGWGVWDAYDTKGRRYFEYIIGIPYWKRKDGSYRGLIASIGYKNFNVKAEDLPKYYQYSFSLDIQPWRLLHKRIRSR